MIKEKEEIFVGALIGIAFCFTLQGLVIPSVILCALLYRMGGASGWSKNWQRIGVPIVLSILLFIKVHSCLLIASAILAHFVFRLGHGIPDEKDKGSLLGRFWLTFIYRSEVDFFVRGTKGFLLGISFFPVFFVQPFSFFIALFLLTFGWGFIVTEIE